MSESEKATITIQLPRPELDGQWVSIEELSSLNEADTLLQRNSSDWLRQRVAAQYTDRRRKAGETREERRKQREGRWKTARERLGY